MEAWRGARRLMFTGIIEELGTVRFEARGGTRLEVRCSTVLSDLSIGASIAVNGVCLTAVAVTGDGFFARISRRRRFRAVIWAIWPRARA